MMLRVSDLRQKDIINITDGRRLGYIRDVDIDVHVGSIRAVVVPGEGGFLSLFSRTDEVMVPWEQIKRIGVDVILVELERLTPARRFSRRAGRGYEETEDTPPAHTLPPGNLEQDMEALLQQFQ